MKRFLLSVFLNLILFLFCVQPCMAVADEGGVSRQEKSVLKNLRKNISWSMRNIELCHLDVNIFILLRKIIIRLCYERL